MQDSIGSGSARHNQHSRIAALEQMKILFLHGWQSTPGGVKPTYLKDHGHDVLNPALPDDDFDAAVRIAQAEFDRAQPDVVVGVQPWRCRGHEHRQRDHAAGPALPGVEDVGNGHDGEAQHGHPALPSRRDGAVCRHSEELVRNSGSASESALIEVGTEHRLADEESLEAMLKACERMGSTGDSILDHPAISGHYLFPQPRYVDDPFMVEVTGAELACYRKVIDPGKFTMVHFHGNGEAVADYVPDMAEVFADLGLNSLFVEYREYGGSTGQARLVAMLGDGEAAIKAAGLAPEKVIAFGRSIGSLYAIELVHRQPAMAGLILESGIADASERFLTYADLTAAGVTESDVVAEVERHFNHKKKLSNTRTRCSFSTQRTTA